MKNLLAKRVKKNNKGFTLVELIIVIAIIAILIAVLAPNYVRYVDRSRWSTDQSDCNEFLSEVQTAVVEAQNNGTEVDDFTITVDSSALTKADIPTSIQTEIEDADPKYTGLKVKHKNDQKLPGESTAAAHKTYIITYAKSDGKVVGKWS